MDEETDVLRCKSPEMVEKEIWMHLLDYNTIRCVMAQAADAHQKRPRLLLVSGDGAMRRVGPSKLDALPGRAIARPEPKIDFG